MKSGGGGTGTLRVGPPHSLAFCREGWGAEAHLSAPHPVPRGRGGSWWVLTGAFLAWVKPEKVRGYLCPKAGFVPGVRAGTQDLGARGEVWEWKEHVGSSARQDQGPHTHCQGTGLSVVSHQYLRFGHPLGEAGLGGVPCKTGPFGKGTWGSWAH